MPWRSTHGTCRVTASPALCQHRTRPSGGAITRHVTKSWLQVALLASRPGGTHPTPIPGALSVGGGGGGGGRGHRKMGSLRFLLPSLPDRGKWGGREEGLPLRCNPLTTKAHKFRGRRGSPSPTVRRICVLEKCVSRFAPGRRC